MFRAIVLGVRTQFEVKDGLVGFFGEYLFSQGEWQEYDGYEVDLGTVAEPWMSLFIHDSDLAIVAYRPCGVGSGVAYVGGTPRLVFDDESEPAAPERRREAAALARWTSVAVAASGADLPRLEEVIGSFLAADDDPEPDEFTADVAEIFAEVKVGRMLRAIGMSVPADLPDL